MKSPFLLEQWFASRGWRAFVFQREAWNKILQGKSGIVNAPTGSGKTYSVLGGVLEVLKSENPKGLVCLWITPIRALAKEIELSVARALEGCGLSWRVGIRTGDTEIAERREQAKQMPEILITTPESLHLLIATRDGERLFEQLRFVIVDEWHELMGNKRGVMMELALAWLRARLPALQTWGISATIDNMYEAMQILLGRTYREGILVRADLRKRIEVIPVLPDTIDLMPWAGHLGIKLLQKVVPVIEQSRSTLIFTNTRSQCEIWYQQLLEAAPSLAGQIAMHHSSISREIRHWVEDALHDGRLKAVVCTSSLDLGVDFRPVETIIQIGSPKGVSRFMQRAGRSGHQPGAVSRIYFVPTHTLELVESAALREAIDRQVIEPREPYVRSFDVLVQWLVTLAVGPGFEAGEILHQVRSTHAFTSISDEEWYWCLSFITTGGRTLEGYDDFHKVVRTDDGRYVVKSKRISLRHRLSIGAIVSDTVMRVKFLNGGFVGTIEEWFISRLKPGDVFWFAGRSLELVRVRGLEVTVRASQQKEGLVPSWMGGRMPLSGQMGAMLREKLQEAFDDKTTDPELKFISPLWKLQLERSAIPGPDQLLIEYLVSREGHHLFVYPFEGRFVHEGMASVLAWRLALFQPITFSIAMNDYGFELLSADPIPIQEALDSDVFSTEHLERDILQSVNATEMARRRFRDIAAIAGLVFQGYPGKPVKEKHLQSSASLIFSTLSEHEPDNLLLRQAYDEILQFQLEHGRMQQAFSRIQGQEILLRYIERPTPFCFPIMVDRLRERLTNESLEQRVEKMLREAGVEVK
ncbi:DNA ligase-associated DEXH box helicase [Thermaurantimonas aggregans]|uniref:DNA ligase-associated DEXH box helicase n=1 Tax=Thermaurantimonas aggregans TaxID=2173829 RepID=A0A401XK59_9FLAO|nr:ligase-associated DNA damage response DEXH box helicase [Thermaurantimonas aggregans]MCX8148525.1 ligase-associated DNA damage response DEXH box helicase [Thermaurantimonas aggregans]GCD77398.1 DNA ligase-associated DEXH box helicase [Thermaurantimonas aggregans]